MDITRIRAAVTANTPAPLHQRLRDAIHQQILDGTLQPGETLPSERAMKDHFGLSRATVRQAINGLIRDGLLQSIAGTGTFVLDPPITATNSGLIGLITSSANFNFFYPQLASSFNQQMREAGYGLLMSLHEERADVLDQMVTEMLQQSVVALAITPTRYGDMSDTMARLRRMGIPVVLIGRKAQNARFDVIATDNVDIGYRATKHLIDLGHRHIAYIGLLGYSTGDDRLAGYRRALEEENLPPHIYQIQEMNNGVGQNNDDVPREHLAEPAKIAAHQIWGIKGTTLPQPTAAFCFNDIVAMGVYKALRDLNRSIPQDVSLVSVDNLIAVSHFEVPLSTFALPGEAIGARSAKALLRRLAGDKSPGETILLPASFISRASTARCAD